MQRTEVAIEFGKRGEKEVEDPGCVVMGLSLTALGVIRSLGRKGVMVAGIDHVGSQIASYSRYCNAHRCPNPGEEEGPLLEYMFYLGKKMKGNGVLLPTNDTYVRFVVKERKKLEEMFKFVLPEDGIMEALNDKRKLVELAESNGMEVPRTYFPRTVEELAELSERIEYPCILKPAYGYLFERVRVKGVVAREPRELLRGWERMGVLADEIVLQEFVAGKDDLQYSFASYFDRNSEPLAVFSARKVRQGPPETGVGTFVESCHDPGVVEHGIRFLKKIGFRGICEIEFKKDERNKRLVMIEVNTRIWSQNSLASRCGVDFGFIAYSDCCGLDVERQVEATCQRVHWLNFGGDFLACFGTSGYLQRGEITLREWIGSLWGSIEFAYFCMDDILPYVVSMGRFLKDVFSRAMRRTRGWIKGRNALGK